MGAKFKKSNKTQEKGKTIKPRNTQEKEKTMRLFFIYIKKTWVFANFANTIKEAK